MVDINGGSLKFAADAQAVDLVLVEASQVGVPAELDLARVGPGASGDEIQHGAFAGAVGADDDAQFALIHVEVQLGDGLEAVEGLVDAFEHQDEFFAVSAHSALASCWRASGAGGAGELIRAAKRRRKAAQLFGQADDAFGHENGYQHEKRAQDQQPKIGKARVAQLLRALTPMAPRTGPINVPRPPTATHTTASSDLSGAISLGLMMPTCGT